jgi:putative transposase
MPRQSRLDTPGALHHIIARGNERRIIFEDRRDCREFLIRLGDILSGTGTICYAWAIIPNHFHLFLRTGTFWLGSSHDKYTKSDGIAQK